MAGDFDREGRAVLSDFDGGVITDQLLRSPAHHGSHTVRDPVGRREDGASTHELALVLALRDLAESNRALTREIKNQVAAIDSLVDSNAALVDTVVAGDDDGDDGQGQGGFLSD